ncbi:helix-turn-helix transcriptional regulator [Nostoc sp. PCC 7107]|uniref:helix-turn-helix domain-containing protein n=1 Tax=Nostoc sp. PCC 7107 TaxID=317936 RepID=UPI00029EF2A6|nr:helix-turn-helix transcriptional regulator [Nostoc sp. PCC 7107]AFY43643.1 helix-turn-helix domain protein [Nostoc sp. PCC 7107]
MTEGEKREPLTPMSLRKRVGLTQRKVAQELDIRSQTVGDWEKGGVPHLTPSKMKRLCEIYQCSLDDLIEAFEMRNSAHTS